MGIFIKVIKALLLLSIFALLQMAQARSPGIDDMLKIGSRNIKKTKTPSSSLVEEANKIRMSFGEYSKRLVSSAYEKPTHCPPPPPGQYGPGAPKPYDIFNSMFKTNGGDHNGGLKTPI
ncbi:hypothetical protein AgCh_022984 [Apium graveolens]